MSNRERSKRTERKLLSWTQVHDDVTSHRTAYERYGLTFDPSLFKVNRETHVSNEVKAILKQPPDTRTDEQRRIALLSLNTYVDVFSEFPVNMQKALVKVGWYEFFHSKRIVIREGHMSENFYLILSGTAVVTVLDKDVKTGELYSRTVALLKKGNSFGEIGLMGGSRRKASVTCREDMEVLTVGRQDFIDIFMYIERDKEPSHIQFLRTVDELQGWPIEDLPYDNPRICLFTYFRRGTVLCKDSNQSEWVYIIKTGSCRVIKSLQPTRPVGFNNYISHRALISDTDLSRSLPQLASRQIVAERSKSRWNSKQRLPLPKITQTSHVQTVLEGKPNNGLEYSDTHLSELGSIHHRFAFRRKEDKETYQGQQNKVFVEIQKLGPNDTYGLESVLFGNLRQTTSTSLVSEGTECILINKKFFASHLSEDVTKTMRNKVRSLPSDTVLQKNLQIKTNWDAYKTFTVAETLLHRKQIHNYLQW